MSRLFVACAFAGLFAAQGAVAAPSLRTLEHVELRGDADAPWISITTDRPANFTSFKLARPPRIVVDFPETRAAPGLQSHEPTGTVTRWGVETLGDEASPVARFVVELVGDADYTLRSDGSSVELRLVPARARPLVALGFDVDAGTPAAPADPRVAERNAAAEARARADLEAALVAQAAREARDRDVRAKAEEKARLEAEARAKADEVRAAKVAAAKARAEEQARLEREAKDREQAAKAARAAAALAKAEEKTRLAAEARAKADEARAARAAAAKAKAEEAARLVAEARAKADAAKAAKLAAVKARAEEKARAEAERRARAEAARAARVAAAKAKAEEKARVEAEARAKADEARAARIAAARAKAEEKARLEAEARAARVAAAQTPDNTQDSRTARAAAAKAKAEEQARLEAEARAARAAAARAKAEEKARLEAEARAARAAAAKAKAEEKARVEAEARARAEAARAAKAEAAKAKAEAARAAKAGRPPGGPGYASLTHVAFRRVGAGSRLTLRLTQEVEYAVREESGPKLVLTLSKTLIPSVNNRRPLDTHYFGTNVLRIVPREDVASGATLVDIELAEPTPFEAHRDGAQLVLDFPAGTRTEEEAPWRPSFDESEDR